MGFSGLESHKLNAVKATSIFHAPRPRTRGWLVQAMQALFWSRGRDALTCIQGLLQALQEQRCDDAWLSGFLKGARHGKQDEEAWFLCPWLRNASHRIMAAAVGHGRVWK